MTLHPEAIATLRRVQAAIRAEPEKLDMDRWYRLPDQDWVMHDGVVEVRDGGFVPPEPLIGLLQSCGTAACIAGHYVAQMGERAMPGETIQSTATDDLQRGDWKIDTRALFYTWHWPSVLREMYEGEPTWLDGDDPCYPDDPDFPGELPSAEQRAEAACRAIDEWIKVDGNEHAFVNAAVRL